MKLNTYLSLCAEYYEIDKPFAPADELSFYRHYAKQANGPILEPMCGTGRFLLPLLSEGFDIEGYDASPYMLEILRQKALSMDLKPNVWHQFVQEENNNKSYDLIIIPNSSFCLVIDEWHVNKALQLIYKQLNKGGKFVFEIETPFALPTRFNVWEGDVRQRNNHSYILLSRLFFKPENNIGTSICRYDLIEESAIIKTEIEQYKLKLYKPNELSEQLKKIGFSSVRTLKPYKVDQPSTENANIVIIECIK